MNTIEQIGTRKHLYEILSATLENDNMMTEPVKGGRLIDLNNGYFAKFAVSICDPEKVEKYRNEYADQLRKNAEREAERKAKKEPKDEPKE